MDELSKAMIKVEPPRIGGLQASRPDPERMPDHERVADGEDLCNHPGWNI